MLSLEREFRNSPCPTSSLWTPYVRGKPYHRGASGPSLGVDCRPANGSLLAGNIRRIFGGIFGGIFEMSCAEYRRPFWPSTPGLALALYTIRSPAPPGIGFLCAYCGSETDFGHSSRTYPP
eukprot:1192829-Prorocentrum_minimum.AAC.1